MPIEMDEISRKAFASEIERLEQEFRGVFSLETIERYVSESIERMQGVRLTDFLPLFVHRFARDGFGHSHRPTGRSPRKLPRSCSCACTTRAEARWLPGF